MENIDIREGSSNKNFLNYENEYSSSLEYEFLGEILERDSLRYKRYLGDDLLKEQLI